MKQFIIRLLAIVGSLSLAATAAPLVQDTVIGNVGSSSACIAWSVSETAQPGLEVFTDAAATQEVTHQVRIELQSLERSRREVLSSPASRAANREVQALMNTKRVAFVRLTGLTPGTPYFLRPLALSSAGAVLASGALAPLTTAATTAFIPESRQLVADLAPMVPTAGTVTGALLVASHSQARYPLIAVVGDGNSPTKAYFDLTLLLGPPGQQNLLPPAGPLALSLSWLGLPPLGGGFLPDSVPYTGATQVAASTATEFVGQGVVVHAFPQTSHAVAGLSFYLDFAVTDVGNIIQLGFNRPLIVESPDLTFGAGPTASLAAGQLAGHAVTFTTPGLKTLTVRDSASVATTTLQIEVIPMNYQNWRDSQLGNALAGGAPGDNPDSDPFPNFIEYIHGHHPGHADAAILDTTPRADRALTIRFDLNPLQREYEVIVQVSSDLGTWHRSAKTPQLVASLPGHNVMEVSWTPAELQAETGALSAGYFARLAWRPTTDFASWLAAANLSGPNAAPTANPDGDRDPNFVEFALDSDPNSGTTSGKLRQTLATFGQANAQVLTVPMRLGATPAISDPAGGELVFEADGLRYRIQGSANLVSWTLTMQEIPADASGLPPLSPGYEYRAFRSPGSSVYALEFVRVRIEQIAP